MEYFPWSIFFRMKRNIRICDQQLQDPHVGYIIMMLKRFIVSSSRLRKSGKVSEERFEWVNERTNKRINEWIEWMNASNISRKNCSQKEKKNRLTQPSHDPLCQINPFNLKIWFLVFIFRFRAPRSFFVIQSPLRRKKVSMWGIPGRGENSASWDFIAFHSDCIAAAGNIYNKRKPVSLYLT